MRLEVCTTVTVEITVILEILTILTGDCCEIGGLHTRDCGDYCENRDSDDGDWRLL